MRSPACPVFYLHIYNIQPFMRACKRAFAGATRGSGKYIVMEVGRRDAKTETRTDRASKPAADRIYV